MFKRDKGGYFALGLVFGGSFALIFFIWLGYFVSDYCEHPAPDCQPQSDPRENPSVQGILSVLVSPRDTLAQWIMAFFTIGATVVLLLTLRSANKTNKAAIAASQAALEANQIMRDEQRPIFSHIGTDVRLYQPQLGYAAPPQFDVSFRFKNVGKTPAVVAEAVVRVDRIEVVSGKNHLTGSVALPDTRTLSQIFVNDDEYVTREKLFHAEDFKTHYHYVVVTVTYRQALGGSGTATYVTEIRGYIRPCVNEGIILSGTPDPWHIKDLSFVQDGDGLEMS